ncbi:MAG: J domain-containing protein [Gammaproteobacteria bacterium]|nr:J domain-containing protein [Gammaproteobacteria bacterium]
METDKRYPLCWPDGWPRTPQHKVMHSAFRVSQESAQNNLLKELKSLGAKQVYLSTNIRLRQDGLPYASQRPPEDKGVAVYFKYKDRDMSFACDKYYQIGDNIHAIGKTINALRGIECWGASDMMERAFTGFEALPDPAAAGAERWQDVLQVGNSYTLSECETNFKLLAKDHHPDKGGDAEEFKKLVVARDQARREFGE